METGTFGAVFLVSESRAVGALPRSLHWPEHSPHTVVNTGFKRLTAASCWQFLLANGNCLTLRHLGDFVLPCGGPQPRMDWYWVRSLDSLPQEATTKWCHSYSRMLHGIRMTVDVRWSHTLLNPLLLPILFCASHLFFFSCLYLENFFLTYLPVYYSLLSYIHLAGKFSH